MSKSNYRQIIVGKRPAGMQGLDELFAELYEANRRPDEADLGEGLVEGAREKGNYIPKPAVDDFAQALLREYRKYVEQRACGCDPQPADYGTWRGHPREQIPWFPTIAADLCNGCGACLKLCKYGALAPVEDGDDDKVMVVEPFKCVVGCRSCADICKPKAITFPPRSMLDAFRPGGR